MLTDQQNQSGLSRPHKKDDVGPIHTLISTSIMMPRVPSSSIRLWCARKSHPSPLPSQSHSVSILVVGEQIQFECSLLGLCPGWLIAIEPNSMPLFLSLSISLSLSFQHKTQFNVSLSLSLSLSLQHDCNSAPISISNDVVPAIQFQSNPNLENEGAPLDPS